MDRDYEKIKAWQLTEELAFLVCTKEFQKSDIRLISYVREVCGLTSEVVSELQRLPLTS